MIIEHVKKVTNTKKKPHLRYEDAAFSFLCTLYPTQRNISLIIPQVRRTELIVCETEMVLE